LTKPVAINTGWCYCAARDHLHLTDNHASAPSVNLLQARCCSWRPTNSLKALNAVDNTRRDKTNKTNKITNVTYTLNIKTELIQ